MESFDSVTFVEPFSANGVNPIEVVGGDGVEEKDVIEDREEPGIPYDDATLKRIFVFDWFEGVVPLLKFEESRTENVV